MQTRTGRPSFLPWSVGKCHDNHREVSVFRTSEHIDSCGGHVFFLPGIKIGYGGSMPQGPSGIDMMLL
jgi:hypothetical protein